MLGIFALPVESLQGALMVMIGPRLSTGGAVPSSLGLI